jgi:hypothetical protein
MIATDAYQTINGDRIFVFYCKYCMYMNLHVRIYHNFHINFGFNDMKIFIFYRYVIPNGILCRHCDIESIKTIP